MKHAHFDAIASHPLSSITRRTPEFIISVDRNLGYAHAWETFSTLRIHDSDKRDIGSKPSFNVSLTVDSREEGVALALEFLACNDRRFSAPDGPAGCITVRESETAWIFFGVGA